MDRTQQFGNLSRRPSTLHQAQQKLTGRMAVNKPAIVCDPALTAGQLQQPQPIAILHVGCESSQQVGNQLPRWACSLDAWWSLLSTVTQAHSKGATSSDVINNGRNAQVRSIRGLALSIFSTMGTLLLTTSGKNDE